MNPLLELIKLRMLEMIANIPVKKEIILAQVGSEFIAATKDDLNTVIDKLVVMKLAIELEYIIEGHGKRSIIFPIDCDLFLKFSNGVHSFSREII
jgi:hypothetical protein